jgi:hypothetical protein
MGGSAGATSGLRVGGSASQSPQRTKGVYFGAMRGERERFLRPHMSVAATDIMKEALPYA